MNKCQRRKRYPYVKKYSDGRVYLRKPGLPLISLPRPYGSHEFEVAYYAALENKPIEIGISRTLPKSINALIAIYYASPEFKGLKPSTARVYRNILWGAARLSETSGCGKLNRNRRLRDVD
jgi:hypothetical protein